MAQDMHYGMSGQCIDRTGIVDICLEMVHIVIPEKLDTILSEFDHVEQSHPPMLLPPVAEDKLGRPWCPVGDLTALTSRR